MGIIARLKSAFGRKGGLVKEKGADVTTKDAQTPRMYKVPIRLQPRVLELQDKAEVDGTRFRAHQALWTLLNKRCPETREGSWDIVVRNSDVFVLERLR